MARIIVPFAQMKKSRVHSDWGEGNAPHCPYYIIYCWRFTLPRLYRAQPPAQRAPITTINPFSRLFNLL